MPFGLSLLHARIRFFESILDVVNTLPVMKWRARLSAEEKKLVDRRKKEIQTKFREELGLLVDIRITSETKMMGIPAGNFSKNTKNLQNKWD